jgi:hypothetical protein
MGLKWDATLLEIRINPKLPAYVIINQSPQPQEFFLLQLSTDRFFLTAILSQY